VSLPSTLDSACGVGSNSRKDIGESVFAGLDDGARLVCDQPARHGIGVLGVTQVAVPSRACKPVVARSAV
jgi:hypothetical protein